MPSSPEPLNFTFWGVGVTVEVPTALDGDHLRYYFDDHLDRAAGSASTGTPRPPGGGLRVVLSTCDRSGFVAALGDARVEKLIYLDAGAGPVLYEGFFAAARRPTPLPPFSLAPLRSTFRLRHAAAACPPSASANAGASGGAVLVTGASGAGKSSLLLGLLQRGWGFVADDIAPVHRAGGRVVRYGRPIGIRSQSLAVHQALGPAVERAGRPIRTASGTTWMTRPEDLGFSLGPASAPVSGEVRVVPADDFRSVARGRSLLLCYRPQCHLERALDALEAWCPDS
jgi:hypothetical protein